MILIGIQGSGKSTFYEQRFAATHLRISLDLAKTRAREQRLLDACVQSGRSFVVDNTNATISSRRPFIEKSKAAGLTVVGYFFPPNVKACLKRNAERSRNQKVPPAGIFGTLKRLQVPTFAEGFDDLYSVMAEPDGAFEVRRIRLEPEHQE